MKINYSKVLADLTSTIDLEQKETNFYGSMLLKLNSLLNCDFSGVFFINGLNYIEKEVCPKDSKFSAAALSKIFKKLPNSAKIFDEKIEDKNYIICKLLIKNSLFGFIVFGFKNAPINIPLEIIEAYISIYSYLIKDLELSEIFKMQLNALQNAIRERDSAYDIIERQNKKLVKMGSVKDKFLLNMSHDLRTPLNSIIGLSSALESQIFGKLNAKQKEYIEDIQTSSLHLLNTINEVLNFSKIKSHAALFNPVKFAPELIINEVIAILSPLNKKKNIKIEFKNNFKKEISADSQKFQQLLFNLLTNAIKYTQEGGKITVKTSKGNNFFILEVKDNGIGIEKKNLSKIFKKFVRLDENSNCDNSTGLGLAIASEIVKMHKGKIDVQSTIGKGSTFKIELPYTE